METEEWRPVLGYEDAYEVSNHGRVRSLDRMVKGQGGARWWRRGKVLSPGKIPADKPNRRENVLLFGKINARVHVLVLEAFSGPRPEGQVCRHLDGNPSNNHASNLAWGTYAENCADAARHGTWCKGERSGKAVLTNELVLSARTEYAVGATIRSLARKYEVEPATLRQALFGITWGHLPGAVTSRGHRNG